MRASGVRTTPVRTACSMRSGGGRTPATPPARAGRTGGRPPCAHVSHSVQHSCGSRAGGGAPPVRRSRDGDAAAVF
ncbi:hypothetical protein F511_01663 [Dorcoceras hygrometricum]|uniref:Uncharacterized protein n=1 Tax=Dorcoceras hygrometricum TaxID=472368 RepID=A0A2Z7BV20_9LAMI|nr:hypothetical protein F511_01663 [Dorcoceras hygrometricum]